MIFNININILKILALILILNVGKFWYWYCFDIEVAFWRILMLILILKTKFQKILILILNGNLTLYHVCIRLMNLIFMASKCRVRFKFAWWVFDSQSLMCGNAFVPKMQRIQNAPSWKKNRKSKVYCDLLCQTGVLR